MSRRARAVQWQSATSAGVQPRCSTSSWFDIGWLASSPRRIALSNSRTRSASSIELCDQIVLAAFELLEAHSSLGEAVVQSRQLGEHLWLGGDWLRLIT